VSAGAGGQAAGGQVEGGGGKEGGGHVIVSFSVVCGTTMMHESLGMIGACPELGSWVNPVPMSADLWPVWKLEVCVCERERERERETIICMYIYIYAHM
jgi:hypothetical protein